MHVIDFQVGIVSFDELVEGFAVVVDGHRHEIIEHSIQSRQAFHGRLGTWEFFVVERD